MAYAQLAKKRWGLPAEHIRPLVGRNAVFIGGTTVFTYQSVVTFHSSIFSNQEVKSEIIVFNGTWGQKSERNRTFGPFVIYEKGAEYRKGETDA